MKTKKSTSTKTERKPEGKPAKEPQKAAATKGKSTKKERRPAETTPPEAEATPPEAPIANPTAGQAEEPAAAMPEPATPAEMTPEPAETTSVAEAAPTNESPDASPPAAPSPAEGFTPSNSALVETPAAGTPADAPAAAAEPRLPPVGTVIQKKDRSGTIRCECSVEPEGRIKYRNKLYNSLSSAAAAAASDLGLTSTSLNGWAWWGLVKPARKEGGVPRAKGKDPVKALEKAFAAFRTRLNKLVSDDVQGEARTKLATAIRERAEVLTGVARAVLGDGHAA